MANHQIEMNDIVKTFAKCIELAYSKCPRAVNSRSKIAFQVGIGPHNEAETVKLVTKEMEASEATSYNGRIGLGIPYPELLRQKCDLCIGSAPVWDWAIEVKMLRFLGDNGKLNDNILMHILSPYPEHRSALTDCAKLVKSLISKSKGILIYGYADSEWPLEPAIDAFEVLATSRVKLGPRFTADFSGLIHPVHRNGKVFGWEIRA